MSATLIIGSLSTAQTGTYTSAIDQYKTLVGSDNVRTELFDRVLDGG